jgi:hypothetical protein
MQIDDILILANTRFVEAEELGLAKAKFAAKDKEKLSKTYFIKFNGSLVK